MKFFIPLVFGEQASGSIIIFWILVSSAVLAIPILIGFAPFTNAVSATYVASIAAPESTAVVNLLANYLLIPVYGLKGCAWATVFAYGASLAVFLIFGRFRFSVRQKWILPAVARIDRLRLCLAHRRSVHCVYSCIRGGVCYRLNLAQGGHCRVSCVKELPYVCRSIDRWGMTRRASIKEAAYKILDAVTPGRGVVRNIGGERIRFPAKWSRYYEAGYEPETFRFFRDNLKPGDAVLDIGGHIGLFAVVTARLVGPDGRVFSFEPTPFTRNVLEEVVDLNNYTDRVEVRARKQ